MRLASHAPPFCAGCHLQKLKRRHVDFEAAYDGPVIPNGQPYSIDDLILCEDCVADAAKLLGFVRKSDATARAEVAETSLDAAVSEATRLREYTRHLEAAVAAKPEPVLA